MIGKNRKKGCAPCRTEPGLKKKEPRMDWFLIAHSKIRLRHLWGSGREEVGRGQEYSTHTAIFTHRKLQAWERSVPSQQMGRVQ